MTVKITFIDANGSARMIDAKLGSTIMEVAIANSIQGIEAECGGACSCATCHVYIDDNWASRVGKAAAMEEDMLDFAFEVKPTSRLSCQIKMSEALNGLVVHVPSKQA
jgi:ferredoxin, 2Fe-2S